MNTIERSIKTSRVRAKAGDEIGLLVNLLRGEKIGYRMLLRNVAEIAVDDYELVVTAVLILTNRERIKAAEITKAEFLESLETIDEAKDFRGKNTLKAAISDAMKLVD